MGEIFMKVDKGQLLSYFRNISNKELFALQRSERNYKEQASMINTILRNDREQVINNILYTAKVSCWGNADILDAVLMVIYVADIVMLEARNSVWPYEYMAFARRIGELWEQFCKVVFQYPTNPLSLVEPPIFEEIQQEMFRKIEAYISGLDVDSETKRQLAYYYKIPWLMVDSGGIKLGLDLHFTQFGMNYNCDFKSGFSSNEKGNTNRLLMVASIYHLISDREKMIIFVRQEEEQNNHYLQTLKKSGIWEVYCADEAYGKMGEFTGFDLRKWLDINALWKQDISDEFRNHLKQNDLLKYLTW